MDKTVKIDDTLIELVRSIRNRCIIFGLLCEHTGAAQEFSATILEDMFEDCQEVIEYCKVKEK